MKLRRKLETARRLGLRGVVQALASATSHMLWTREGLVVFQMRPEQLNPIAPELSGVRWTIRSATVPAFLAGDRVTSPESLAAELRSARPGQRVHWIEVQGTVISWGFSTPAAGSWPLTETRSRLTVPMGGVCLTAFETLPAYRGRRLYPAILTQIVQERFREGAPTAFIWCRQENVASYRAIERVGFRKIAFHRYSRLLGVVRRSDAAPTG